MVKTRLAASLGINAAASAYRTMVETLLTGLRGVAPVELRFAPDDAREEIQPWLREGWTARPQKDGDLGQRLLAAFSEAFAEGSRQVIIIGSDCPSVAPEDIRAAWGALADHDLVLGPAADGGYWLLGMQRLHECLFQRIPWSTGSVLEETVRRATEANLRLHFLRTLRDVDTEEDWRAFLSKPA